MITIVVADDHPIVREGLRAVLAGAGDMQLLGEAADGDAVLGLVARVAPDVLLLDLDLPGRDGVEVVRALRGTPAEPAVLLFTAYDSDPRLVEALQAGARGCVLKGAPRQVLFDGIRRVAAGGRVLPGELGPRLLAELQGEAAIPLTPRQREVVALLAEGTTNAEIAARLRIGERTAKFHVEAVLARLGARNRTEAVRIALQRGILRP